MTTTERTTDGSAGERSVCRVVVLHESDDALQRVSRLCEHLEKQHWLELELHFEDWPFSALSELTTGEKALQAAIEAQIVVVSAGADEDFSGEFLGWAEQWAARRAGREGALVGVLSSPEGKRSSGCSRDILLHSLALRAGMDYLEHFPGRLMARIPDAEDWCTARAATLTDTLSEILHSQPGSLS